MIDLREMDKELSRLEKKENKIYHQLAGKAGMSDSAFAILGCLYEEEVTTQNDLAEFLWLPKQTVNSAVNKLVETGYVYLKKMKVARNNKSIHLTEKGDELCKRYILPVVQAEKRALLRMTEAEIKSLFLLSKKQSLFLQEELSALLEEEDVEHSE